MKAIYDIKIVTAESLNTVDTSKLDDKYHILIVDKYNNAQAIYKYIKDERSFELVTVMGFNNTDLGELYDGYHSFNDLYEQRLVLSAALANTNPDKAWKSKLHHDGSEPFGGGWFIMGFETKEGSYTYHYELKDWDLFKCKEIPKALQWDGHTSKDVRRLLSL